MSAKLDKDAFNALSHATTACVRACCFAVATVGFADWFVARLVVDLCAGPEDFDFFGAFAVVVVDITAGAAEALIDFSTATSLGCSSPPCPDVTMSNKLCRRLRLLTLVWRIKYF